MPKCYCHKGRGPFDPRSTPLTDWAPSPDHYPQLKKDGGRLDPWNVRLSHVLCNREDYGWRMRIRGMLERKMSLEDIAEELNQQGVRTPHGSAKWSAATVLRRSSPNATGTSIRMSTPCSPSYLMPVTQTRSCTAAVGSADSKGG